MEWPRRQGSSDASGTWALNGSWAWIYLFAAFKLEGMQNRRNFLGVAAGTTLGFLSLNTAFSGLFSKVARAADKKKSASPARFAELIDTTTACIKTGEACLAHCERELAQGNKSMADCNTKVHEMLALTKAMLTLASMGSAEAIKLAPVCAEACHACAQSCAEHREHFSHGMHLECKDCMEACQACDKACQKVMA